MSNIPRALRRANYTLQCGWCRSEFRRVDKPVPGRGVYCSQRCQRADLAARQRATVAERFWARVIKGDGCWTWPGGQNNNGYGKCRMARGTTAHRLAWTLTHGPIPAGLVVMHKCDNRSCVRPDHLQLGTQAENMADMRAKGRYRGCARPKVVA